MSIDNVRNNSSPGDRFVRLRSYLSMREEKSLSAAELADICEVSGPTISEVEKGNRKPSPRVAKVLSEKYGVSENWYLTGIGQAPWEKSAEDEEWDRYEDLKRAVAEGRKEGHPDKSWGGFLALSKIINSPEVGLVESWIRAGKDSRFRRYIFMIINAAAQAWDELTELRAAAAEPVTVLPPAVTPRELTYEPAGVELKYPPRPGGLAPEDSTRWDRNLEVLQKWAATAAAIWVPTWALARFCLEVHHFYSGGNLAAVTGVLQDFIEEGRKPEF